MPEPLICGPIAATTGLLDDHLAGVGRGLRRIVLPGGRGAVVEQQDLDLVAGDPALRVGLVDRQQRAVLDQFGVVRVGAGKGQVYADRDRLVGGGRPIGHRAIESADERRRRQMDIRDRRDSMSLTSLC